MREKEAYPIPVIARENIRIGLGPHLSIRDPTNGAASKEMIAP
jgi:hypothetical protein